MKHSWESPILISPKYSLIERSSLGGFLNPYTLLQRQIVSVTQFGECLLSETRHCVWH